MIPQINPYPVVTAAAVGSDAVATLPAQTYAQKLCGLTLAASVRGVTAKVYMGYIAPSAMIDTTPNGWSNTADYPNPRPVPPGQSVIVVWEGQAANAAGCTATFHLSV
jgi:hypothetical protein